MEQFVFYINCPNCGKIVELISPFLEADKAPREIWAYRKNQPHHSIYSTKSRLVCVNCGGEIDVYWHTEKRS